MLILFQFFFINNIITIIIICFKILLQFFI